MVKLIFYIFKIKFGTLFYKYSNGQFWLPSVIGYNILVYSFSDEPTYNIIVLIRKEINENTVEMKT